jgi:hypothetical protein
LISILSSAQGRLAKLSFRSESGPVSDRSPGPPGERPECVWRPAAGQLDTTWKRGLPSRACSERSLSERL